MTSTWQTSTTFAWILHGSILFITRQFICLQSVLCKTYTYIHVKPTNSDTTYQYWQPPHIDNNKHTLLNWLIMWHWKCRMLKMQRRKMQDWKMRKQTASNSTGQTIASFLSVVKFSKCSELHDWQQTSNFSVESSGVFTDHIPDPIQLNLTVQLNDHSAQRQLRWVGFGDVITA